LVEKTDLRFKALRTGHGYEGQRQVLENIGERIKALRTEQGMTLAELGEKTNLSTSYLSQVERGKNTPSLATLAVIARAFNIELRYFFEAEAETVYIVRANECQPTFAEDVQIGFLPLMPEDMNTKIEIHRVSFQPGSSSRQLEQFSGEELIFVLDGELVLTVGDEQFILTAGDSIHFDALQPHSWCNESNLPCVINWGRAFSLPDF
jgi:transcriptional regulator with XRE-family HTH domain